MRSKCQVLARYDMEPDGNRRRFAVAPLVGAMCGWEEGSLVKVEDDGAPASTEAEGSRKYTFAACMTSQAGSERGSVQSAVAKCLGLVGRSDVRQRFA